MTIITHQLRPESRGSVHVTAADASKPPAIRFNFLAERVDRDCVLACMRTVRRIVEAPPLAWLGAEEFAPGPKAKSDDELIDFVTRTAETTYHPVGTCRMGSDAAAVVDDRLRVQRHLRIARRRRLDHADADLGQHQRALDHDRREGGAHGAGGRRLIEPRRSVRGICHAGACPRHPTTRMLRRHRMAGSRAKARDDKWAACG